MVWSLSTRSLYPIPRKKFPAVRICIDGSSISMPSHRYFMMNKPAGVVSATKDHNNSTALDLIYEHRSSELQIAGRLDIDTTGSVNYR